jgi:hypothetical protein
MFGDNTLYPNTITGVTHDSTIEFANELNYGASEVITIGAMCGADGSQFDGTIKFNLDALRDILTDPDDPNEVIYSKLYMKTKRKISGGNIKARAFRIIQDWNAGNKDGEEATDGEIEWKHNKHSIDGSYTWGQEGAWYNGWHSHDANDHRQTDRHNQIEDEISINSEDSWFVWDITDAVRHSVSTGEDFINKKTGMKTMFSCQVGQ